MRWRELGKNLFEFHQMCEPTFGVANLLDYVCATSDPSKDSVLVVKPGSRCKGDEKLAAVGARTSIGHRYLR